MAETDTDGRLPRSHRAGILLGAVGVIALLWCIARAASGPGGPPEPGGPNVPAYVLDGSPPWTWPRPAEAGADIWGPVDPWQPWPPEWQTN